MAVVNYGSQLLMDYFWVYLSVRLEWWGFWGLPLDQFPDPTHHLQALHSWEGEGGLLHLRWVQLTPQRSLSSLCAVHPLPR